MAIRSRMNRSISKGPPGEDCYELKPQSPAGSLSSCDYESSASTSRFRKGPALKSSQWRFLAWVAVLRNNRSGDEQSRTCPMVDCKTSFDSPELMHMHLTNSNCIFSSTYECFETGKPVHIGKCDSAGCKELKSRFTSAMSSSMQSVKRRISGGLSKSPIEPPHDGFQKPALSQPDFPVELHPDSMIQCWELPQGTSLLELDADIHSGDATFVDYERLSHRVPSELAGTTTQWPRTTPTSQSQNLLSIYHHSGHAVGSKNREQQKVWHSQTDESFDVTGQESYRLPTTSPPSASHLDTRRTTMPVELQATSYNQMELRSLDAAHTPYVEQYPGQGNPVWGLASSIPRNDSAVPQVDNLTTSNYHAPFPTYSTQEPISCIPASETHINFSYSDKMSVDDLSEVAFNGRQGATRMGSGMSSGSALSTLTDSTSSYPWAGSTSQSSLTSHKSFLPDFDPKHPFFSDGVLVEEPEVMEAASMSKLQEHTSYTYGNSSARHVDTAGVSIDDYVMPGYVNHTSINYQVPGQLQTSNGPDTPDSMFSAQDATSELHGTDFTAPSLASTPSTAATSPPSALNTPYSSRLLPPGKSKCRRCGLVGDMSNRKRHEKVCKKNPDRHNVRRYPCLFRGCKSSFGRKDNLKQHQRSQDHFGFGDVALGNIELKINLTPNPGSPVWDLAMQALEQNYEKSHFQTQEDENWMDVDAGMKW